MESHAPLQQIQVVDKYAYIAAYNLGLMIVDIEDSKNPSVVSTTRLNVNARAVSINNGAALVGGENTLFTLDISDRAAPTISSGIELDDVDGTPADIHDLNLDANFLHIAGASGGPFTVDVSPPFHQKNMPH